MKLLMRAPLLALALSFVLSEFHLSADEKDRPNVLFIAVDDLRPELGCYGTRAKTPNIDALAKSGIQFNRAYCNQAVCGASRISLMTGLYPEFTGERTYHVTNWRSRWKSVTTMNQHFKENGYTTVGLGKIYHGSNGPGVDPDNWNKWIRVGGKQYADPASNKNRRKNNGKNRGPSVESAAVADDTYADGNRAKVGAAQIYQLAKKKSPFFLAVGFTKPHLPFIAPTKYWSLYRRDAFSFPKNLGKPPGYPEYASNRNAGELRAYSDIPLKGLPTSFPQALNQKLIHGYHACVSYTDRNIGVLLDALKKSGADKNTVVVLWADHGWKLGDHSSWCKHTNFECDNRVPLVIRTPGAKNAGSKCQQLVELIDLYPTLCNVCGLDEPTHLQGKSFVSTLADPSIPHRKSAYSSYPHGGGQKGKRVVGHSIRTKKYRYTEWWEVGSDRVVDSVLTDIESDPGETTAITDKPDLKKTLSKQVADRVKSARLDKTGLKKSKG